jgi:hypothetical protein
MINAPHAGANSLFANIDSEPTDPYMIWDIPLTSQTEERLLGWRGNGTFEAAEFPTKYFDLTPGTHRLIIRGREANAQIYGVVIRKSSARPSAPTGLQLTQP